MYSFFFSFWSTPSRIPLPSGTSAKVDVRGIPSTGLCKRCIVLVRAGCVNKFCTLRMWIRALRAFFMLLVHPRWHAPSVSVPDGDGGAESLPPLAFWHSRLAEGRTTAQFGPFLPRGSLSSTERWSRHPRQLIQPCTGSETRPGQAELWKHMHCPHVLAWAGDWSSSHPKREAQSPAKDTTAAGSWVTNGRSRCSITRQGVSLEATAAPQPSPEQLDKTGTAPVPRGGTSAKNV